MDEEKISRLIDAILVMQEQEDTICSRVSFGFCSSAVWIF